ncbi:MAG: response regulator [Nitrospirota bacterium]
MENQEKVNILLVDDTPANLLSGKAILAELGQNIVCANSGEEALKHLLHEDFAVILMDVNMPGLNGFETAALIRQRPRSAHTPIIFVTATGTTEMERGKGYLFGAVDYIFSPVVPEILRAKVSVFSDLFRMTKAYKRQAEELAVFYQKLEGHHAEVDRLNQQLEATNKELEAFSYSVSHDLRNALSGITGFSEILKDEYADRFDEEGKENLQCLYEDAWRMNDLIEALLKLSRLSRQEMKHEPVDLTAIAKKIAGEFQKTAPERQVKFVIEKGIIANGDSALLQVALQNLLSNAWKYAGKQPQAKIEFGVVPLEAGGRIFPPPYPLQRGTKDSRQETYPPLAGVGGGTSPLAGVGGGIPNPTIKGVGGLSPSVYFVRDNGVGFDMSQADKLFRAFNRLHTEEEFKGIGIGLTIVQRVIHRHNGIIWAEAKPNEGATFYFTLG